MQALVATRGSKPRAVPAEALILFSALGAVKTGVRKQARGRERGGGRGGRVVLLPVTGFPDIVLALSPPSEMFLLDDNRTLKLEKTRSTPLATKHATLIVLQGVALGTSIPLDKHSLIIGRGSECGLRVDDNLASRQHACVRKTERPERDPLYRVEDLGSTNGTFVNGRRVTRPFQLELDDTVRIGDTELRYRE